MATKTREHLHSVLSYLQESESKDYYRRPEEERDTHVYHGARALIRHFDFEDLMEQDALAWQEYAADSPDVSDYDPKSDPYNPRADLEAIAAVEELSGNAAHARWCRRLLALGCKTVADAHRRAQGLGFMSAAEWFAARNEG
jgi:hypothetical protein